MNEIYFTVAEGATRANWASIPSFRGHLAGKVVLDPRGNDVHGNIRPILSCSILLGQ